MPPAEDGGLEAFADFADETWQAIKRTKFANDKASFQTAVNLSIERAETQIAENPGMSIEDMKKIQDNIFTEIDTVGNSFWLDESKEFASQFKNNTRLINGKPVSNEQLIKQKFQTSTAEIATQRALIDVKANHEAFVASGNLDGMEKMYEDLSGNLLSAEAADAALDRGFEEILVLQERQIAANEKAQAEANLGAAQADAFNAWTITVTEENPNGDLNVAFNSIAQDERVPAQDKQEAESEVKTMVDNRRAEAKLNLDNSETAATEAINKAINDNDIAGLTERIRAMEGVSESFKTKEVKRAQDYIAAVNNYKANIVTSDSTRVEVNTIISQVRNGDMTREQAIDAYSNIAAGEAQDIEFTDADFVEQERRDKARLPLLGPHRRPDGTLTGPGFLGEIPDGHGMVNTEVSIGVRLEANGGKETDIPTLVPTLTEEELDYFRTNREEDLPTKDPDLWRGIVQKAVDHANKRVREGESPFLEAADRITSIGESVINTSDGATFINSIFSAAEDAEDVTKRLANSTLGGRRKQLRDSIEALPNFLKPGDADKLLRDIANKAVLELDNKFSEGEYTKKDIDDEMNRLLNKYTLTSGQISRALIAKKADAADNLKDQQTLIRESIQSAKDEGNDVEAKRILAEAVSLGVFKVDAEGNIIDTSPKETKTRKKQGLFQRIFAL